MEDNEAAVCFPLINQIPTMTGIAVQLQSEKKISLIIFKRIYFNTKTHLEKLRSSGDLTLTCL